MGVSALIATLFVAQCPCADLRGIKLVTIDRVGKKKTMTIQQGVNYTVEVIQDDKRRAEPFPEDWLILRIKNSNQKTLVVKPFYSSYQEFRIDIVDLDGDGRGEFVFALGSGRGTSARRETLSIEHLEDDHLRQIVSTPLSDYYGPGSRWWYSVEFKDTDGDGVTDLELKLHSDGGPALNSVDSLVPSEHTKVFRWRRVVASAGKSSVKQLDTEFRTSLRTGPSVPQQR
jgi:hypothetical protein